MKKKLTVLLLVGTMCLLGAVSALAYNPETKRFSPKSSPEMVKEYEAAYQAFAEYKRRWRNRV